jgi:hypothetical protein
MDHPAMDHPLRVLLFYRHELTKKTKSNPSSRMKLVPKNDFHENLNIWGYFRLRMNMSADIIEPSDK